MKINIEIDSYIEEYEARITNCKNKHYVSIEKSYKNNGGYEIKQEGEKEFDKIQDAIIYLNEQLSEIKKQGGFK